MTHYEMMIEIAKAAIEAGRKEAKAIESDLGPWNSAWRAVDAAAGMHAEAMKPNGINKRVGYVRVPCSGNESTATSEISKRKYIRIPPELTDGEHWTVHRIGGDCDPRVLGENLESWLDDNPAGETIELQIIELTDAEFEAMPVI